MAEGLSGWRAQLHEIIFEADTPAGRAFDIAIIAVPTGIVTVELASASRHPIATQACPTCSREGHDGDAVYCEHCGAAL